MTQTKEEIKDDLRELQYQYEALIAEGSYKLANQRLERIKKLKEQLKQMDKTKVQDSMDTLRLCGYTSDASIQVGPWMIYQEGNEISVHRGGRAWAQGFKSVQEAKAWIQKKERWIETGKDECPIFTKGSKDDDATEHGSIEQYGKGTETESMGLSDDPVQAQDSWISIYEKAFGNQPMNTLESLKSKSDVIRHFQKLGIDPNSADAKEAIRRWFNSDSKPVKDSDPRVAEAMAIINLCGGVM